jgi:hypothetical protein
MGVSEKRNAGGFLKTIRVLDFFLLNVEIKFTLGIYTQKKYKSFTVPIG